jgi:thiol-disulfide isomerase/thioredoxin
MGSTTTKMILIYLILGIIFLFMCGGTPETSGPETVQQDNPESIISDTQMIPSPVSPAIDDQKLILRKSDPPVKSVNIPNLKAILLVGPIDGPTGSATRESIRIFQETAQLFKNYGVTVYEFYSPNSDWDKVKQISAGAHFLIYSGHGVYDGKIPPGKVGGLALDKGSGDTRELNLHPNAIIMLLKSCFAAGNSGLDIGQIDLNEARRRVAMYSEPYLEQGFAGYYANWYPQFASEVIPHFFSGKTFGDVYKSFRDYNANTSYTYSHPQVQNQVMWINEATWGSSKVYNYAFCGKPNVTLASVFSGNTNTSNQSDSQPSDDPNYKTRGFLTLVGSYYKDKNLNQLFCKRNEEPIDFDWEHSSPLRELPVDQFSIRWEGTIQPLYSEVYTFSSISDDGIRVWVNNRLLIDKWQNQGATEWSGNISLLAGRSYPITIEYYENSGRASMKLYWASSHQPKEIIPKSSLFESCNLDSNRTTPQSSNQGDGLLGTYFKDKNLSQIAHTRVDPNINFDWQAGTPGFGIPNDNYSIRWTGQVLPRYSERYTFYTTSDDGVRLWINNQLIIDKWVDQAPQKWEGYITLEAGKKYNITLEYYEHGGGAMVSLGWSSSRQIAELIPKSQLFSESSQDTMPPREQEKTGLYGAYYRGVNLQQLAEHRVDKTVDFEWSAGSPFQSMPSDNFSIRWTGQIIPRYSENYTFYVVADDGVRLWINNKKLIDKWIDQGPTEWSGQIPLQAGRSYNLTIEYYEHGGGATIKLFWSSSSQSKEIIPSSQVRPEQGETTPPPTDMDAIPAFSAFVHSFSTLLVNKSGNRVDPKYLIEREYFLLYYAASWCSACRRFTPTLVEFYNTYHTRNTFEVILYTADQSSEAMFSYMQQAAMPWVAIDFSSRSQTELSQYPGSGIPQLVLVNKQGEVLATSEVNRQYLGCQYVLDQFKQKMGW